MEGRTFSKRVFPLSSFEHHDLFRHYYAFGNSFAEDFLQSVSVADCREPSILSLGCGDMRSVMFTIFKNFGFKGRNSNGFTGAQFWLNDRSASVIARDIVFLYLCTTMPESVADRKEWVASIWSVWYNLELQPQHEDMLNRALHNLTKWSNTWKSWSQCPLGNIVSFSSPATFAKVKVVWSNWLSNFKMSVPKMNSERVKFQSNFLSPAGTMPCKDREEGLRVLAIENVTPNRGAFILYPSWDNIIAEHLQYLREGTVLAEVVLDIPTVQKTVVNPTMFERDDGLYTLHYSLTPYLGFNPSFQYTHDALRKTMGKSNPVLKCLPVADAHFKSKPLLANSVQQFSMWLQATANMTKHSGNTFKVMFDVSDSIEFCCLLLHHPEMYCETQIEFDAIYTSNLFNHLSPPALVLSALPLLKPSGTLFTATFKTPVATSREYLEMWFGFGPELFPVFLGIHCISQDGNYSSAINHEPCLNSLQEYSHCTVFPWRKVTSQKLVIERIEDAGISMTCLLKLFNTSCLRAKSAEGFLCVLQQYLKQVQSISHPYLLNALAAALKSIPHLQPYLMQLQTQSFLHGVHMHVTVTEDDCPLCKNQPIHNFIQQYSLSFGITAGRYTAPAFTINLGSCTDKDFSKITSFVVNSANAELELIFYLPKCYFSRNKKLTVDMFSSERETVLESTMSCLKRSCIECIFLPLPCATTKLFDQTKLPLGDIVKHIGDSCTFNTNIFMNDSCLTTIQETKLKYECLEHNQVKLRCGALTSMLLYPYTISSSRIKIEVSKKRKVISVRVERDCNLFYKGKPTYHLDPSNTLALPRFECDVDTLEIFCNLQALYGPEGHPVFNAKRTLSDLFNHYIKGEEDFTLAFPSKIFKGFPDVHAYVYVHDLRFSPVFGSPALDVSYCFLDEKTDDIQFAIAKVHLELGCTVNIRVDESEYSLVKDLFKQFSAITQCMFSTKKHSKTFSIESKKEWEHFDHAILFPLYPNPANSQFKKYQGFVRHADSKTDVGEGLKDACSFCNISELAPQLVCGKCNEAKYCSIDCKEMHWLLHRRVCNPKKSSGKQSSEIHSGASSALSMSKKIESKTGKNRTCDRCKKPATLTCLCKSVSYCSKSCRALEWPLHCDECNQLCKLGSLAKTTSAEEKSVPLSPLSPSDPKCSNCGKVKDSLKRCKCKNVLYCDVQCQRLHWPQHATTCTAIKK